MMRRWSFSLWRVCGIQIELHLTFLLFLVYAAALGFHANGVSGMIWSLAIVVGGFTSVVLHEFGHAFAARAYGIPTKRILLLPIGGIAQLGEIPREPRRELLVTLAGPAVNFVLAAYLAGTLYLLNVPLSVERVFSEFIYFSYDLSGFGRLLIAYNLVMGFFNILPVFPMDGGRILRSLLALKLPYLRATQITVWIGRPLAFLALAAALVTGHWLIGVLFLFIFVVGELEWQGLRRRERFSNVALGDLTARHVRRVPAELPLSEALPLCLFEQPPELVLEDAQHEVVGIARPHEIVSAARGRNLRTPLSELVGRPHRLQAIWPLSLVAKQLESLGQTRFAVYEGGRFLGVFRSDSLDQLLEWHRDQTIAAAVDLDYRNRTTPPFPIPAGTDGAQGREPTADPAT
jgi:Zn-dependent protease